MGNDLLAIYFLFCSVQIGYQHLYQILKQIALQNTIMITIIEKSYWENLADNIEQQTHNNQAVELFLELK